MDELRVKGIARKMRRNILEVSFHCNKSSHIGGSLSMVEILSTLYGSILNYRINEPLYENRDRFILSKGHGALALYSILYEMGFIKKEQFFSYQQNGSEFIAHPIMNVKYGIESSNGSLGHGLSLGIGISLAAKIKQLKYRTFVLLGDGECNEGSVWEAVMAAPHYKLNNLVAIIDRNRMQNDGESKNILKYSSFEGMWKSCGWKVIKTDGHDINALYKAMKIDNNLTSPKVIIAETIKGKGIPFMENNSSWHHGKLTENLYKEAIDGLDTGLDV